MMPVFLLPLLSALGSPRGKIVLYVLMGLGVIGGVIGGVLWFMHHERSIGEASARAEQQKADQAYIATAEKKLSDWQAYWAPYAAALTQSEKARDDQQKVLATLAAAGGNRRCLGLPVVRQLQSIGGQQQGNRSGSVKPAGAAASGVHR